MSGKHLLPGFGDEEEDNEDTITRTVQEITVLFRDCERRLKEIHNTPDEGSGDEVCLVTRISGRAVGGRRGWEGRTGGWVGQACRRSGGWRAAPPPPPPRPTRRSAKVPKSHSRRCAKTSSSASPSSCRSAPLLTTPHPIPSILTPPRHTPSARRVSAPLRALPAPSPRPPRPVSGPPPHLAPPSHPSRLCTGPERRV